MGKRMVATHKQVDPNMVTSDDLIRAIKETHHSPYYLAQSMGWAPVKGLTDCQYWHSAVMYIAMRIDTSEATR